MAGQYICFYQTEEVIQIQVSTVHIYYLPVYTSSGGAPTEQSSAKGIELERIFQFREQILPPPLPPPPSHTPPLPFIHCSLFVAFLVAGEGEGG